MWIPWINHNPDKLLTKFIFKHINQKILYPLDINGVTKYCGTNDINSSSNIISLYDCEKNDFNSIDIPPNITSIIKDNIIGLVGEDKLAIIVFNNKGLVEAGELILESLGSNSYISENITFIRNNLQKFRPDIDISEISKVYPMSIENLTLEIFEDIEPNITFKNNITKIIPKRKRIIINKLKIKISPKGEILSLQLSNKHPNADDNLYYCLGDYKFKPLTLESLNHLITRINTYNLDDCYWTPKL